MLSITDSLIIRTDIIKTMYITLILTDVLSYVQNADTKWDKQLPFTVIDVKKAVSWLSMCQGDMVQIAAHYSATLYSVLTGMKWLLYDILYYYIFYFILHVRCFCISTLDCSISMWKTSKIDFLQKNTIPFTIFQAFISHTQYVWQHFRNILVHLVRGKNKDIFSNIIRTTVPFLRLEMLCNCVRSQHSPFLLPKGSVWKYFHIIAIIALNSLMHYNVNITAAV